MLELTPLFTSCSFPYLQEYIVGKRSLDMNLSLIATTSNISERDQEIAEIDERERERDRWERDQ